MAQSCTLPTNTTKKSRLDAGGDENEKKKRRNEMMKSRTMYIYFPASSLISFLANFDEF